MTTELLLLHAHARIHDLEHALAAEQGRSAALEWRFREAVLRCLAWSDAAEFARLCSRAWKRLAKRERGERQDWERKCLLAQAEHAELMGRWCREHSALPPGAAEAAPALDALPPAWREAAKGGWR